MRVNPNLTPDLLAALNLTRQSTQDALLQLASGRRVNQPSDDPAASAILVDNHDQFTFTNRYVQTLSSIQAQFQTADSAISSVVSSITQALALGVQAANSPLSDADRAAIATQLTGIRDQLVSLADTSFEGTPLFAGTNTTSPPYVLDSTVPSGVRYDGNDNVNHVQIGDGYTIASNKPGSQLFTAAGHDVFQSLTGLIEAVQTNTGIAPAITTLRDSFDYISTQRVFFGNTLNQAEAQTTNLGNTKLQLSQQENTLASADIEAAASRLVNSQASTNATLAAIGKISQLSLFDFLK
jgi:flagellar hook-associated protein 3 FlgL